MADLAAQEVQLPSAGRHLRLRILRNAEQVAAPTAQRFPAASDHLRMELTYTSSTLIATFARFYHHP